MSLIESIRIMDRRLRLMLLSTALLLVSQIGQFAAIRDINTTGHESSLTILFALAALFFVPTSLILSGVIMYIVREQWREHERLMILGVLNFIIALNLTWFFIHQCSWSQVFGLTLKSCVQ